MLSFCRAQWDENMCDVTCLVINHVVLKTCSPPPPFYRRLVKVHSPKWLAVCSSGCPTPKLQLVLFSETADQCQLWAHCWQQEAENEWLSGRFSKIQSLQLTATAEDLPCKLGTWRAMEMIGVTWADLHPAFHHMFFRLYDHRKRFLDRNVFHALTLLLSWNYGKPWREPIGPGHSIFTSIHCSKQASPGRGMSRCIQGSEGLNCDPETCLHLNQTWKTRHGTNCRRCERENHTTTY